MSSRPLSTTLRQIYEVGVTAGELGTLTLGQNGAHESGGDEDCQSLCPQSAWSPSLRMPPASPYKGP